MLKIVQLVTQCKHNNDPGDVWELCVCVCMHTVHSQKMSSVSIKVPKIEKNELKIEMESWLLFGILPTEIELFWF